MLASIITPTLNQGQFLEKNILSIKGQNYKNIEHIIIDGCSRDNTIDIIKKYESTYNMKWISETDKGMYEAINKGLKISKGDILCYLNSDDIFLPWTIESVVNYFKNYEKVDLIYGDIIFLNNNDNTFEFVFCPPFNYRWLKSVGGLYQPTVFWRRRVYEEIGGFDENLKCIGDYEYWTRIGGRFTIRKINEFLAIDRIHINAKRFINSKQLNDELLSLRKQFGYLDKKYFCKIVNLTYRLYGFIFKRYYLLKFLYGFINRNKRTHIDWVNLLSINDLSIQKWTILIKHFFPPLNSKKRRFLIKSDLFLRLI